MIWLLIVTLGGPAIVAVFLALSFRRERLARPMLNGIPLPVVDDVRWKRGYEGWCQLGNFQVWSRSGLIRLDEPGPGQTLGFWSAYGKAVGRTVALREQESLAARALKQIEEAK